MVKLEFTGYCKDCPCAELELDEIEYADFYHDRRKQWSVRCTHETICDRWYFKKESKQNE